MLHPKLGEARSLPFHTVLPSLLDEKESVQYGG